MTENRSEPAGDLYLSTGLVLLLGRNIRCTPHRHFTASLTVSLDEPLYFRTSPHEEPRHTLGFVARSNALFELDTANALVMNLQLDPEKSDAMALDAIDFGEDEVVEIPEAILTPLRAKLRALTQGPRVYGHALKSAALTSLHPEPLRRRTFDPRIARVLSRLKRSFPEAPSSGQLAREVGLSEGRLLHLFAEHVGVPLRRYVLSLRLRRMLFFMAMGQTLTDAAQEAGFSDSAHLARVYRDMYGLPPSKILRSPSVRIHVEQDPHSFGDPHAEHDRMLIERYLPRKPPRQVEAPTSLTGLRPSDPGA